MERDEVEDYLRGTNFEVLNDHQNLKCSLYALSFADRFTIYPEAATMLNMTAETTAEAFVDM